ncbi:MULTISPECIES: hypothetical protein [Calothrix]|uniref:Holin n=2 Tax=Calothrix TaxID=1186 RepID=A0ABR8A3U2_9CYAN|nr:MULTISPECIES: hypothetical protein [Calothrix]MBD2194622.1 hypothetical protein [Calothrix parietina FACHB-288]MBD2223272.1 hypothetical protein [Calothrix anomala FACHB-343]
MNSKNQNEKIDRTVAKSIFASRTFWGAVLAGVASLVPIAVKGIKANKITVDDVGQAVLVLCGVGTAIVGRVNVQSQVYTPDILPGPNKSDYENK